MAYPEFHYGNHDQDTGRGSNWRDLTEDEQQALRQELSQDEYAGLDLPGKLARLTHRERTGDTTRTVPVTSVSRDELLSAIGIVAFAKLKKKAKEDTDAGRMADALLDFVRLRESLNPSLPDFETGTRTMQQAGVYTDEDAARVMALGQRQERIADEERFLAPSRADQIGLGGLLLTEQDLEAL